jgi:hypothetical protein
MMLLSACEDSDNKKFIGTWVTTAPTQEQITVTFNSDGTVKWTDYIGGSALVTTGRYELNKSEKYLTIYPDKDPDDKMPFNPNELGFQYNITSDTLTFYKTAYSEEPWYCFKRQG